MSILETNTIIIYSYPRSGCTWIRYILEALTGRPTLGTPDNLEKDIPICKRIGGMPVDVTAPPSGLKRHQARHLERGETRPLIVPVRNYKECIVRHNRNKNLPDFNLVDSAHWYFEHLEYFDAYPYEKLMIYYEDLIERPEEEIHRIGKFIGVPGEKVSRFCENHERHKNLSLEAYHVKSYTRGDKTIFHSSTLSPKARVLWDRHFQSLNDVLYEKYLRRYKE